LDIRGECLYAADFLRNPIGRNLLRILKLPACDGMAEYGNENAEEQA
jgi:hypothetical protein